MLKYRKLVLGELETNCYVIWDEASKKALIVDPADEANYISEICSELGLEIKGLMATHGHYDHLLGAYDLQLMYQVPFYANSQDNFLINRINHSARFFSKRNMDLKENLKIQVDLDEIGQIKLGNIYINVVKTPGHTPGSVCFWQPEDKLLFTGDTWMAHSYGLTSRSYSNLELLKKSLRLLQNLPKETLVLPGHEEEFLI